MVGKTYELVEIREGDGGRDVYSEKILLVCNSTVGIERYAKDVFGIVDFGLVSGRDKYYVIRPSTIAMYVTL